MTPWFDEIAGRYRVQHKFMGQWFEFPINGDTVKNQVNWVAGWGYDWKVSLPMAS